MFSIIGFIVKIYKFVSFSIELQKQRLVKKFRSTHTENIILEEIYEEYLEKVLSGEIFPESKHGYSGVWNSNKKNIFLRFRTANKGYLTKANEEYLISKLKSNVGKWYVPYILRVIDSFSERLMGELLESAIKTHDPSYNSCFIKPAMRVHNFQINDYLIKRFTKSTQSEKAGILRAFYWVSPNAVWRKETGEIDTDYSTKYIWNKEGYFEKDYNISKVELIRNKDEYRIRHENKIEVLIQEYRRTKNKRMKEYVAHNLPKKIDDFPDRLREMGFAYLQEIRKQSKKKTHDKHPIRRI